MSAFREYLPHDDVRRVGVIAEGSECIDGQERGFTERYWLSWDPKKHRWCLWANREYWEPFEIVAFEPGFSRREPDLAPLLVSAWTTSPRKSLHGFFPAQTSDNDLELARRLK